eukprot:TRINITY_DN5077_c0_g1_i2.p2 TRINITY_DN5077_c0_g1~~TRINITY_DN5077_c0_g1_i2.p2  ORF type:complete len:100 (-),score=5.34 TRINITY_DN5077_c0_g1_i2:336-635(-)
MLLDVPDPIPNVVERGLIRDIIHQQYTHGSSVVSCCDSPETFLTSCIPYLKFDALPIKLNGSNLKVNPDRHALLLTSECSITYVTTFELKAPDRRIHTL